MKIQLNVLFLSLSLFSALAHASEAGGVTVGGTRLIYNGAKKEASLNISNTDTSPYLIQSWADAERETTEKVPFIVTPPLFRLEGGQKNRLRIVRTAGNLPEDRESLYWLNIKSIPSSEKKENVNTLQIAVRTRIKLIYRPAALKTSPLNEADKLSWSQSGSRLTVNNPTSFYMNFQEVRVGGKEVKEATYVAPASQATFTAPAGASGPVTWKLITDYGGVSEPFSQK